MKNQPTKYNSVTSSLSSSENAGSEKSTGLLSGLQKKCRELAKSIFPFGKKSVAPADLTPKETTKKLCTAACAGRVKEIRKLLNSSQVDPNATIRDPVSQEKIPALLFAIKRGQTEAALTLLKNKRVDPTIDRNKALEEAVNMGNEKVVRALLKNSRVNPQDRIQTAMRTAATNRDLKTLNILLDHPSSKNIDMGEKQAFQIAAQIKPEIIARRLIENGEAELGLAILKHEWRHPGGIESKTPMIVNRVEL